MENEIIDRRLNLLTKAFVVITGFYLHSLVEEIYRIERRLKKWKKYLQF